MAEVFVCEKGSLTAASKRALKEAGVVVAEVDDLKRCEFVRASEVISHSDLVWAALEALTTGGYSGASKQRERLVTNLFQIADEARKAGRAA